MKSLDQINRENLERSLYPDRAIAEVSVSLKEWIDDATQERTKDGGLDRAGMIIGTLLDIISRRPDHLALVREALLRHSFASEYISE